MTHNFPILVPAYHFNWAGGAEFLLLILKGLLVDSKKKIILVFVTDEPVGSFGATEILEVLAPVEHLCAVEYISPADKDAFADWYYRAHSGSVVLFGQTDMNQVPSVGYIYDFQHEHLGHLFSEEEKWSRRALFRKILVGSAVTLVYSLAAKGDIETFFGRTLSKKVIALPFTPLVGPTVVEDMSTPVGTPEEDYFLISNQFWRHKNHLVAVHALKMLLDRGHRAGLVMTGTMHDYRGTEHIDRLKQEIVALGLSGLVTTTGFVSKAEQIRLMKGAVAVIQPSLFEGGPGGGAASMAVALGRPVLLADIPINHEILFGEVRFFDPHSALSLTNRMEEMLTAPHIHVQAPDTEDLLGVLGRSLEVALNRARRNMISAYFRYRFQKMKSWSWRFALRAWKRLKSHE